MILVAIAILAVFAAVMIGTTILYRRSRRHWEQIAQRVSVSIADRMAEHRACFAGIKNADEETLTLLRKYRLCVGVMSAVIAVVFGLLIGNVILVVGLALAFTVANRWRLKPLDMTVEVFQ